MFRRGLCSGLGLSLCLLLLLLLMFIEEVSLVSLRLLELEGIILGSGEFCDTGFLLVVVVVGPGVLLACTIGVSWAWRGLEEKGDEDWEYIPLL